ncbi:MAG: phosphoribosylformylglycinamidine synthase [Deltaproteobacteria bacterium]|nr:phosphoribosylformylglycinamidine synthase [Deltaproteobacteria bacterium]MBN2670307.1 phosphoribosylformylglycinamidine synthase [Deltaproteobacteria bacterium]
MPHRIAIKLKSGFNDANGTRTASEIESYLAYHVDSVRVVDVYTVDAELGNDSLTRLAEELCDSVIQEWTVDSPAAVEFDWLIEVAFRPGVTDNVGRTATESARMVLPDEFTREHAIYTSRQYLIRGELSEVQVENIATGLLCNTLIQRHRIASRDAFDYDKGMPVEVPKVTETATPEARTISLDLSDEALAALSREMTLALSLDEMKVIQAYYQREDIQALRNEKGLPPEPTDVEIEVFAQTWSEHCKHKIFSALIEYRDGDNVEKISSLYKTYIQGTTKEVRALLGDDDYCLSVFKDNAGVWKFTDDWNLVFKVETHNSPSALDPYGGALTGIVGVNRDPHGTGKGSRLFCNTDVFCLADPFYNEELPPRLLHPRRVMEGVREGVEHGGNKSGIPTVNGSLVFDERFLGKPLVFCGTGGIMPKEINGEPSHEKLAYPGDRIIMVGGRIGKDGIHGATFSSEELHEGSPATAVQIGDPITQKRMTDFLLRARDESLMTCLTDNGAGGLSSSIGEMAEGPGGAKVELAHAPLKYQGLQPWEIFISEAQERMTAAVSPEKLDRFISLANEMGVEATDLGEYTAGPYLELFYNGAPVALFDMEFLHKGLPQMTLQAAWTAPSEDVANIPSKENLNDDLAKMLGRLDICSKEYWVRQYDHEVQGGAVVKPLCGAEHDGPSDAAVVRPILDSMKGVAVSHGICPRYSDLDAYHMSACAVDEAMRNLVCVGANPDKVAALDNFCWCDPVTSPSNPDGDYKLAQLVRSAKALKDVCIAYRMPLVSGKDSMKNDYSIGDTKISIPPTLLVTAVGEVEDSNCAVTMDAKNVDDLVYLVGDTYDDMGKSHYLDMLGIAGGNVPKLRAPEQTIQNYRWLHRAMKSKLVASCHDLSDGGLAVAAAETAFSGNLGLNIDLSKVPGAPTSNETALFSETPGRLLVTVPATSKDAFEIIMGNAAACIGEVVEEPKLTVLGQGGQTVIESDISTLKESWQKTLRFSEVSK